MSSSSIQMLGLASGLDTQSIVDQLMNVEKIKSQKIEEKKTLVEWKQDAWKEMNSKLYTFYKDSLFKFKSTSTYTKKLITSSDEGAITATATSSTTLGIHSFQNITVAKGSFLTGDELDSSVTSSTKAGDLVDFSSSATGETQLNISLDGGATTSSITISEDDTIDSIVGKIDDLDLDLNINFDTTFNRFFLSSKNTGENIQIQLSGGDDSSTIDELLISALKLDGAATVGSDATFTYNGTQLSSSSNEVTVNGLSVSLHSDAESATISINNDVEGIYDAVKSFITKYNELILDIDTKLNADYVSRDYQPLTDDEKDAMSDTEIEAWENKIKGSLLRKDGILTSITSKMRSTLTLSSGVDTTGLDYNYLSSLGIVTGSYTEKGILHIEGDEDDTLYSSKDNKLKEAIQNNPDGVLELMTALGTQMYEDMNTEMSSTNLSSALTFYNDKQLKSQVSSYETMLGDLEDKYEEIEERYYKQFTAMEQAIQQANSTSSWLTEQLSG